MPLVVHNDSRRRDVSNDHFLAGQISIREGAWLITAKGDVINIRQTPDPLPVSAILSARDVPAVQGVASFSLPGFLASSSFSVSIGVDAAEPSVYSLHIVAPAPRQCHIENVIMTALQVDSITIEVES